MNDGADVWVFGYGSLIWRPDFNYLRREPALLRGWKRRFWQGSHDHRGMPHAPGRVVTLIAEADAECGGMAYLVEKSVARQVFESLDHREKNGYQRFDVSLDLISGEQMAGVVYIAPIDNFAFLGEAPIAAVARQIVASSGPSGRNIDYLLDLAEALRKLGFADDHVFELECRVKRIAAD